jgi:hypothetical protein
MIRYGSVFYLFSASDRNRFVVNGKFESFDGFSIRYCCDWSLWLKKMLQNVYWKLDETIFLSCPNKTAVFHEKKYNIILVLLGKSVIGRAVY